MHEGLYDRLAVPDAAQAMGLTEGAIRQRIQRGTLESERDAEGRVYVLVRRVNGRDNGGKTSAYTRFNGGSNGPSEALEILKSQNEFLKEQLNHEREAHRENRRIIAGLVQRVPELEAPRGPRETSETVAEKPGGLEERPFTEEAREEGAEPRPSWWRRFLLGEGSSS